MNISLYSPDRTARTCTDCALQRAENLSILGSKRVLELCIGPSLQCLQKTYKKFNIDVCGNDIDPRWKKFYKPGNWLIGDALTIPYVSFDTVVFAPPLSHGCSGRREDALMIDDVSPKYQDFLAKIEKEAYKGRYVLVLPARCLVTKEDKNQLYSLLSKIKTTNKEVVPLTAGTRGIRKYVDIYCW
jgi:hypothetical protein